jgi:beta-lactamase class A
VSANAASVITAIEGEFAGFAGTGGVFARNLGSGEEIAVNADAQTATASTIKVPILIEVVRQSQAGLISLDDRIAASPVTRAPGSGILRDLSYEVELSVYDIAVLMIVVSDNSATNMLIDLVGLDRVNQTMVDHGFPGTQLRNRLDFPKIGPDAKNLAVTTPHELSGIMTGLAEATILDRSGSDIVLKIMSMQHYRDQVPRYLPFRPYAEELGDEDNGLRIANKTGGWKGMRADMALVEFPGTRYTIGIVTEGDPDTRFWSENAGERMIGRISRSIFDYWGGGSVRVLD